MRINFFLKRALAACLFFCAYTNSYAQFDRLDVFVAPAAAGNNTGTVFNQGGTIISQGQNITVKANIHRTGDGACSGANQIGATLIVRTADTLTDPSWSGPGCEANRWIKPVSAYTNGGNPYVDASTMTPQNTATNQAAGSPQGITMIQMACGNIGGTNAVYTYQTTLVNLPTGRYSIEVRADNYNASPSYQNNWNYSTCSGFASGSGTLQYVTVGKQGLFRQIVVANTQTGGTAHDQYFYGTSFQPGNAPVNSWNITGSATGVDAGSLCQNDPFLVGFETQTFKNTTLGGNVTGVQLKFSITAISGGGNGFATKTAAIPFRTDCPTSSNPGIEPGGGSCVNITNNGNTDVDQMWQISSSNANVANTTATIQNGDNTIKVTTNYLDIAQMIKDVNGGLFPTGKYQISITPVATFGDGTTQTGTVINKPFSISSQTGCSPIVTPVTLTSFDLTGETGNVLLKWQTASEFNTSYFEVEKSNNGKDFISLHQVETKGSPASAANYLYNDINTATNGATYYRLKIMDFDGTFKYSPIRSINNLNKPNGFIISPNPGTSNFVISEINTSSENIYLAVFNALGQQIFTTTGTISAINTSFNIAMNTTITGVYLIKLQDKNNNDIIKLIKK